MSTQTDVIYNPTGCVVTSCFRVVANWIRILANSVRVMTLAGIWSTLTEVANLKLEFNRDLFNAIIAKNLHEYCFVIAGGEQDGVWPSPTNYLVGLILNFRTGFDIVMKNLKLKICA